MTPFETIASVIKSRRTTKPPQMNGSIIPREQIEQLLTLADWAPTHGHTEPWRFFVMDGTAKTDFCMRHAELYQLHTAPDKFIQGNFEKIGAMGNQASHLIAVAMQRGDNPKIPVIEELAATACAIQHILLAAQSLGIASYWGSGGLTHHPAMKTHFGLGEQDHMMGLIYLGYSDEIKEGKRLFPMSQKVRWM